MCRAAEHHGRPRARLSRDETDSTPLPLLHAIGTDENRGGNAVWPLQVRVQGGESAVP